jgi:hypothetical protein
MLFRQDNRHPGVDLPHSLFCIAHRNGLDELSVSALS